MLYCQTQTICYNRTHKTNDEFVFTIYKNLCYLYIANRTIQILKINQKKYCQTQNSLL